MTPPLTDLLQDPTLQRTVDEALTQEQQRLRYRASLWDFSREVLGYADLTPDHQALCAFLETPDHFKLILMPRYSFKSSLGTIGYILWRLIRNPNDRTLIYSDATAKAEGFLTGIKQHILGLSRTSHFRQWWPNWEVDPQRGVWNQSAIVIADRTHATPEPSVDTAGIETSKVGMHYDLIIFDDLVSDKNVTTKDLMDKVAECYQKALSLLKPGGDVVLLGTRWHFGDLYGRLLAQNAESQQFATFIRKMQTDENTYPFASIGLDAAFHAQQLRTQGRHYVSCLYQNEPVSEDDQTFRPEHFTFYHPAKTDAFKTWLHGLYITCVLDPIPPPTSDHGDDAAITVVGTDADHTMYVLDAVAGRMTPDQQIEELFSLHAAWHFRKLGVETNAFQRILWTMIEQRLRALRADPRYQPFSIVEFSGLTQGNKEQRIQGLSTWHEHGLLRLPGERLETLTGVWSQLAWQLLEFPHSRHDDLADSLAYHLQLKQAGTVNAVPTTVPYGSALWAAQEERKEAVAVMQRRPRWQRRPIPELLVT